MMSIVVTTLEELAEDGIPTPLLDAILENLLPARRAEKPASYQLARQVPIALAAGRYLAISHAGAPAQRPSWDLRQRSTRRSRPSAAV